MVTVIEKQDKTNYKSPWDWEGDDEQPESDNDNSLDQIKTYRLSNPWTPIQDLENVTVGFDRLFFNKDNNSHIINNLLYGNFNISKEGMIMIFFICRNWWKAMSTRSWNISICCGERD